MLRPIETNAGHLKEVIANLVMNAVEAIGEQDGAVRVRTAVEFVDRGTDISGGVQSNVLGYELAEGQYVLIEVVGFGPRHGRSDADPDIRSVFHHEIHGQRARSGSRAGHRPLPARRHPGEQRTGARQRIPGSAADAGERQLRSREDPGSEWSRMMAPQREPDRQEVIVANALLSGLNDLSSRAGHDLLGPLNQAASLLALFLKRGGRFARHPGDYSPGISAKLVDQDRRRAGRLPKISGDREQSRRSLRRWI